MPRYIAEFRKRVLSDSGHQSTIVQRKFDLDAVSRDEALNAAKKQFCDLERIADWSSRADELNVHEADFPS